MKEKEYLEKIEASVEHFGTIQRNFVLDKSGIHAIVSFIKDFQGKTPAFSLSDPVIIKGKNAATRVVEELAKQLKDLEKIQPPEIWERFHNMMISSIRMQLAGYKEMLKVFEDNDLSHVRKGQEIVNTGMSILEGGSRAS